MSQSVDNTLPSGFEALEPFVAFWAVDTATGRTDCRSRSSDAQRQSFYEAIKPLAPSALEYLNARSLNALDPAEQRLMLLLLSFAHVAMAVELHREEEPKHAGFRASMPITRAPADLPAAQ